MPWNGIHWTRAKPRLWYKPSDVAKVLQVHVKTVRKWVKLGKLAHERTPTGRIRFAAADIERWVSRRAAA